MTSLYMAAQENHLDVAKELLRHKANIHLSASVSFFNMDLFRFIKRLCFIERFSLMGLL